MPFLVDSTLLELQALGVEIRLIAHPIVSVDRDRAGRLVAYHGRGAGPAGSIRESLIQIHLTRIARQKNRAQLEGRLRSLFAEVRGAVSDWRPMVDRLYEVIDAYRIEPPPLPTEDIAEAIAFLEWLADNNFTFLGVRDYAYTGGTRRGALRREKKKGLGMLADPGARVLTRGGHGVITTPAIREFLMRPEPLIVTKSNLRSRIHRRAYADYIGVKRYGKDGKLAGEVRFIGLFTSTAYNRSVLTIPISAAKAEGIIRRAGFSPDSHSGKVLVNILESYPRDELFQVDEETLFSFAMTIMALDARPRIRVLARRDKFDRFVSVLVFVPRDRYDSDVRQRIGDYLAEVFDGRVSAYYPTFLEGTLTRIQFIIGRSGGETPDPGQATLEAAVARIVERWPDALEKAIRLRFEPARAEVLANHYRDAFPVGYRHATSPEGAVRDIETFARLTAERPIAGSFHRDSWTPPHAVALKLIHLGEPIALSTRVPMLENMGLRVIDEQTFEVAPFGKHPEIYVHEMALERADGNPVVLDKAAGPLIDCFMAVWYGRAANDGYNALVVNGGLAWRDVTILRAVSRYIRQAGTPFTQHYMWETLSRHAGIASALVALFHARFDPENADERRARRHAARIEAALEAVDSLDEDRIIRRFLNVVEATLRTNFFQRDAAGEPHQEISFKLDSAKVEELPLPRPFREIFVYSPRVEGIHLRFGKVARGGIRWSDRPLDFRTEVLGLAKAQQAKNAVIVPVGAKGGFVAKQLPASGDRAAFFAEGKAAYRVFISSLLDITDNLDRRRRGAAGGGGAARRRRSLSGGRGRQGNGDLLRHRQRDCRGAPLLARRRLRQRRLARLRPQEDGDHGARRLGGGEAAFPRDGRRHPDDAVHRGRRRRHVGRRVRQRHASVRADQAGRRLRPSRHLHRSRPRSGGELRRAETAVRPAAVELAGLRPRQDLGRRRRFLAAGEGDPAQRRDEGAPRPCRGQGDAERDHPRHPQGARRPPVLRRHRHLRARQGRGAGEGRRPGQRRHPHHGEGTQGAR